MNTNKSFAYGISAVLIRHGWRCLSALAGVFAKQKLRGLKSAWMLILILTGCPEPDPVHTHTYATAWSHNATQHWHECTANDGAKTDLANHTGDPCAVCEYASGSQNPDPCECNGKAEDCDCEDCDCETCETKTPAVAHAQAEPTHTLANNLTITLDGTDSAGNITAYAWQCESYTANQGAVSAVYTPAQVNALIANANTATATVAPRKAGTYVFKLTVTDNDGESATDNVEVVVEGYTVTTTLDINANTFSLFNTTLDFTPAYSGVSNPADFTTNDINSCLTYTITVVTPNEAYTNTWNSANGFDGIIPIRSEYEVDLNTFTQTFYNNGQEKGSRVLRTMVYQDVFRFYGENYASSGSVPAINGVSISRKVTEIPPVTAHAQAEPTHTLASDLTITLDGTDSAGNITAYTWQCVSYTADQGTVNAEYTKAEVDALITNANTATATVAPRKAGTYVFKLTVTDNDGGSDTDTVTVVVEAWTATKDVNVTFPAFATNPTVIDLNPIYNGITIGDLGDGFNTSDIRFEIKDDRGNDDYWSDKSNIDVARDKSLYGIEWTWPPPVVFTQTFYHKTVTNENKLGEYSFRITDTGVNGYFDYIYSTTSPGYPLTSLPPAPLILQLSRTATE